MMWCNNMIVNVLDVSCNYYSAKLLALSSHLYDKLAHVLLYVLLSGIPDSFGLLPCFSSLIINFVL